MCGSIRVSVVTTAESSKKRHKITAKKAKFNSAIFSSKDHETLFNDHFPTRTVLIERNVEPNTFDEIHIGG